MGFIRMNYTESDRYHQETWLYLNFDWFSQGETYGEEIREEIDEAGRGSCEVCEQIGGLELKDILEFEGNLKIFQGKLTFLTVLYVKFGKGRGEKLIEFYKMNRHSSLLRFIGVQREKTLDYMIFEYQSLRALPGYLQKACLSQKLSLALEMTQIFSYFASKDFTFSANLSDFCLTDDDRLIFFNPTSQEEYFTLSPESLASGVVSRKTSSWSLGMILFELLTDKHPFSGESLSTLRSTLKDLPESEILKKKEEYFLITVEKSLKFNLLEDLLIQNNRKLENWMIHLKDLLKPVAKSRLSIEEFLEWLN
jgi:hypothetical protein